MKMKSKISKTSKPKKKLFLIAEIAENTLYNCDYLKTILETGTSFDILLETETKWNATIGKSSTVNKAIIRIWR